MLDENRLESLVADCLDRIATEGLTALDDVCRRNPAYAEALRAEVEAARSLGLLDPAPTDPSVLGEFRILERLGEGGMGLVYLAEQGRLGRRVAVKMIRPEFASLPGARERLRREAEAAAQLRHPSIVPIIGMGEQDGLPFFAMEHVGGVSLDRIVRALEGRVPAELSGDDLADVVERLTGERVEAGRLAVDRSPFEGSWERCVMVMLAQAARAIGHAHAHGVLHRDVKPSNLMLTAEGRVVLLDFGLALRDRSSRLTRSGYQPGSLLYMAPEQVEGRGDDVDERTDVYALGVTCHELLTLAPAFDAGTPEEVRSRILAGDAPSPGVRYRGLGWDAETVCLVAMEVEPERRYLTAADLARDLENVLDGTPILARRPSSAVRFRRWVRRSPARAAAALLAIVAFGVAPTVIAVLEARAGRRLEAKRVEAEGARDEARAEFRRADASFGLLTHVIEQTGGWSWVKNTAKVEALDADVEKLVAEFADDPARQARLLQDVSDMYWSLGLRQRSQRLLERALPELRRGLDDAALAGVLRELGSRGAQLARDLDVVIERLEEARTLLPDGDEYRVPRAEILQSLALACRIVGRTADAAGHLDDAARVLDVSSGQERDDRELTVLHEVAKLEMALGDHTDAERHFRELLRTAPTSGTLASSEWRIRLGEILAQRGEIAEAEALIREGIEEVKPLLGSANPRVGMAKGRLGLLLDDAGRRDEAEVLLRDATELLEGTGVSPGLHGTYACRLATILQARGKFADAAAMAETAVRLRTDPDGKLQNTAGHCLYGLVQSLYKLGRRVEALDAAKRCLVVNRRIGYTRMIGLTQRYAGALLCDEKRWEEARDALEEAIEVFEESDVKEDATLLVWTLERLTLACRNGGDAKAAVAAAQRSLRELARLPEPASASDEARLHARIAGHLYILRQYGSAIAPYRRAVELHRGMGSSDDPLAAAYAVRLGYCLIATERPDEGRAVLEEALPVLEAAGRERDAAEARRLLGRPAD